MLLCHPSCGQVSMSHNEQRRGLGMDLWQRVRTGAVPAPSLLWQRSFGAGFVPGTGSTVGCQPCVLILSGFSAGIFPTCSRSCEQTIAWSFVSKDKLSSLLVKEHLLTFTFHKTLSCSFFNHERWNWIWSCYPCGITSVSSCVSTYLSIHFISANRFTICFIIAVPAFLPLIIFDKQMLLKELLLGQSSLACRLRWLLAAPTQRSVFVPRHN